MAEGVLIIIAGIFLWLVIFAMRSSAKETKPKETVTTETAVPDAAEQITVRYRTQKHITLYEYDTIKSVVRCEVCDGENSYDAKYCCICGSNLIADGGNEDVL